MIFVSTACIKKKKISESVEILAKAGFTNIELTGGSEYYPEFENDLTILKKKYNLNYRCHNYFPPPVKPFVLNLASLDESVHKASINNTISALRLSKVFDSKKLGLHAGFYIDIKNSEIGKKINKRKLFDKDESKKRFYDSFHQIKKVADGIEMYVENNVVSLLNYKEYGNINAFMLTCYDDYLEMKKEIDFKLLLDVAHLKVSCNSLGLNFSKEFSNLVMVSDYIHISDNDALSDLNFPLDEKGDIATYLGKHNLKDKDFTLEVYSGISELNSSYEMLENILNAK